MTGNQEFKICVAGIAFGVRCQYPSTVNLCRDYRIGDTDGVQEWIEILPEHIEQERQRLLAKKNPGEDLEASTAPSLERLHLCRRIAELLPKYDRVLFHGSTLAVDGNGVLFTAKSGTGKSTHTRLWREAFGDRVIMINDDKPFLHIGKEGITAYGTPWRGKHGLGSNISAPLRAIVFVNRGVDNRIEPISPRELFPLLLQQTYTPDDPAAMAKTLALVERLSRGTCLFKLACNMNPEAALVAFSGIEF